jgi:glyoxylase-like metal-dependent hydrolase (beta-lactamase superfamily II)
MLEDVGAEQLAPGLWRWTAYYPEWKADVGCLAYRNAGQVVLVDPLAPPGRAGARRFWTSLDAALRGRDRPVHVVLTVRWHERHIPEVVRRYARDPGVEVWSPADAVRYLTRAPDHAFSPGERLPAGIQAFDTGRRDEVVLWLPRARALVSGDVLLGGPRKPLRVCPKSWLPGGVGRTDVAKALAPLTELPVRLVVPLHGEPVRADAAAAVAAALAEARSEER